MIKFKYLICTFLFLTINHQNDKYSQALTLITSSDEYKSLKISESDYIVSDEIIDFYKYGAFFNFEYSDPLYLMQDPVKYINNNLSKLNSKKRGKVKIFFSEEKDNIFFAEFFYTKDPLFKYSDSPIFGKSYLYMFKQEENNIFLLETKTIHYN